MRITIATGPTYPFPPVGAAGAQKVFLALAREFVRQGHEVTVFARAWAGQPAEENDQGIKILRWGGYVQGVNIWSDLGKDFVYAARAAGRVPGGDVVVTNDFWLPFMLKFQPRSGVKLVIAAHRFPKHQYFLYRHADAFIAVSKPVAQAIAAQQPGLAAKVHTVNNPVDTTKFEMVPREHISSELVIGCLGRIHPEKGVHLLLAGFRELIARGVRARLKVAGPWQEAEGGGGEGYWQKIHRLAEGLPVEISGPLDNQKLPGFYQSLDVFCLPSLADLGEAMPVAPLEAMACGAVPVVSNIPAFMEYLQDHSNGRVFDHHASEPAVALADALEELSQDRAALTRMSLAGRATAEAFSATVAASKYLAIFEGLLPSAVKGHA